MKNEFFEKMTPYSGMGFTYGFGKPSCTGNRLSISRRFFKNFSIQSYCILRWKNAADSPKEVIALKFIHAYSRDFFPAPAHPVL